MNVKPIIEASIPVAKKIGKAVVEVAAKKALEIIKEKLDEKNNNKNQKVHL